MAVASIWYPQFTHMHIPVAFTRLLIIGKANGFISLDIWITTQHTNHQTLETFTFIFFALNEVLLFGAERQNILPINSIDKIDDND